MKIHKKNKALILVGFSAFIIVAVFVGLSISVDVSERKRRSVIKDRLEEEGLREQRRIFEENRRLSNDIEWVMKKDNISLYTRFILRFPDHPQVKEIQKRVTEIEVEMIERGEYGEMPKLNPVNPGGSTVRIELKNDTQHVLVVRYVGPEVVRVTIPVNSKISTVIIPGNYKVAASVDAPNVSNYFGKQWIGAGEYSSTYYIRSESFPGNGIFPGR